MERTREIGILKSMGASKFYILALILRETTALAVAGIILGIAISFLAGAGIHNRFPIVPVEVFNLEWIVRTTVIAIVGAMAGAIYPAFKAARKDPIEALAYE
jgi:putative ABC transport system permease protein